MTIKEIETLSGMSRANVRYYESEGLLEPRRSSNGYRDYSEDDLTALLRIRLLRSLDFSLEDVRALQRGETALSDALERQLAALEQKEESLRRSREVCREMRADGADYATLDAPKYLDALSKRSEALNNAPAVPSEDAVPKVTAPWRRFFARALDTAVYSLLWQLILLLCGVPLTMRSTGGRFADTVMLLLLTLLLEPLFLSLLGTTPGKWLLGLSVTDLDGGRLSYGAAMDRCFCVLWYGRGLDIPIFNLVRIIKSKMACDDGEELPWESESVLVLRDERSWRPVAMIGAMVLVAVLDMGIYLAAELPKHRGELTTAEFCENFNRYADYFDIALDGRLLPDGSWADSGSSTVLEFSGDELVSAAPPAFHFTEENGVLTGVSFDAACSGFHQLPGRNEAALAVLAFTRAQKGAGLWPTETKDVLKQIEETSAAGFTAEAYGVEIVWDADSTGYTAGLPGGFLWPEDNAVETHYEMHFSMKKVG